MFVVLPWSPVTGANHDPAFHQRAKPQADSRRCFAVTRRDVEQAKQQGAAGGKRMITHYYVQY